MWTSYQKWIIWVMVELVALAGIGLSQAFAQGVSYQQVGTVQSSVPDGFMPCANDGETCSLNALPRLAEPKTLTIFYGVPGKYIVIRGTSPDWTLSSFVCLPGTFGVADPAVNVRKACWVFAGFPVGHPLAGASNVAIGSPDGAVVGSSALTSSLTKCADDFETCSIPEWRNPGSIATMWTGYYGAGDKFVKISGMGNFTCSPSSIGVPDPVENVKKSCYIRRYYRQGWMLRSSTLSTLPSPATATYSLSLYEGQSWAIKFPIQVGSGVNNIPESKNIKLVGTISALPPGYVLHIGNGSLLPASFAFTNDVRVSADNNGGRAMFSIETGSTSTKLVTSPVLMQP